MSTRGHHGLLLLGGVVPVGPVYLSNTPTVLDSADTTNHLVSMPASVGVGDLLIALLAVDGTPTLTTPSGWTSLAQVNATTAAKGAIFYTVAAGTEGGTTVDFVTSASERMMAQVVRIQAGTYSGTPEQANTTFAGTLTPDPPSLSPSWGSDDTLWLAILVTDTTRTISVYPLPDNNFRTASASVGSAYTTLGSCSQQVTTGTLNPGTFTVNLSSNIVVFTMAIRPA